ncbi:hypothetical protein HHK36_028097 [Tetracentron sinense]|uniref:CCHC-type domain-containing protein n=1 Tax=Tetracentron sinense TaxID=13715 RepID=A0A834YFZ2_TETSI|nr:hypothetical protein HHK36_028097 [Tetracentron sinense]
MRRWTPEMEEVDFVQSLVPFWVQLHDIPLDLRTYKIIHRLASDLRGVDEIDFQQGSCHQGSFIRVRIYIDISKPLQGWLLVLQKTSNKTIIIEITYERLPIFCYHCGIIGHAERTCEAVFSIPREEREARKMSVSEFGPWLKADMKLSRLIANKEAIRRRLDAAQDAGNNPAPGGGSRPQEMILETRNPAEVGGEMMAMEISAPAFSHGRYFVEDDDRTRALRGKEAQRPLDEIRHAHPTRHVPDSQGLRTQFLNDKWQRTLSFARELRTMDNCFDDSGGACGYGDFGRNVNGGAVGAVSRLYRNGTGCGACYQVKCTIPQLCTDGGMNIVVTDHGEGDYTDFILSPHGFTKLARPNMAVELMAYGVVDIKYRRISCQYPGYNLMFKVHEHSRFPYYLAIVFLYQAGQKEIVAFELWQSDLWVQEDGQQWRGMRKVYGGVWDMVHPPRGALSLRFQVSGDDGKWVQLRNVIPGDWKAGVVYDSAIQLS